MPYERIHIEGASSAIVRTDSFTSVCEPNKPIVVPTLDEWRFFLPRFLGAFKDTSPNFDAKSLKHSKDSDISHVHFGQGSGSSLVCRHSSINSLQDRLHVAIRGTREQRLFDLATRVLQLGIPTATPVALIERQKPKRDGWLLTEHIGKMQDLDRVCLSSLHQLHKRSLHSLKIAITKETISMFEAFRSGGYFHRDMKASNVVVFGDIQEPASIRVGLVDLEGVRSWGGRSLKRWRDALIRLAASLRSYESVTRTDYLRFLRTYFDATGQSNTNWKTEFRNLSIAAQQYSTKSKGRKGNKLDGYQ